MKYFIITAAANLTLPAQNAVTNSFTGSEYGYWHYLPHVWLLTSPFPNDTAADLRDRLAPLFGIVNFMVFEVLPVDWAGRGDLNWQDWLAQSWKPVGPGA